jgi:putative serine protease PepD
MSRREPRREPRHEPRRTAPHARRAAATLLGLTLPLAALTGCSGDETPTATAATTGREAGTDRGRTDQGGGAGNAGADSLEQAFERTIRQALPSVVEIRSGSGLGSGVVWDDEGHVVTNAHVVGDATTFQVQLAQEAGVLPARLVGSYPPDDLAVIRIDGAGNLRPATFGDSAQADVGDIVLAMGNPLGLSASVTNGIVSATGRVVGEPAGEGSLGAVLPDAIQTSAAINPGNSGGALVNLDAEVIGIPTLAALSPGGSGPAPGIGFAVSSARVKRIAPQLIRSGRVSDSGRAALGVGVTTVAGDDGRPAGVGVVSVTPGGPAATAGVRPGDVITQVAGEPTPSTSELATVLATQQVGAAVDVVVRRDGAEQTLPLTLGDLESP